MILRALPAFLATIHLTVLDYKGNTFNQCSFVRWRNSFLGHSIRVIAEYEERATNVATMVD